MKILITGGKSAKALKLRSFFPTYEVNFGDYGEVPHIPGGFSMIGLGHQNPETTAHNLLDICLSNEITCLVPLYASEAEALSKALVLFEEFGIDVLLPSNAALQSYLFTDTSPYVNIIVLQDGPLKGVFHADEKLQPKQLFTIA